MGTVWELVRTMYTTVSRYLQSDANLLERKNEKEIPRNQCGNDKFPLKTRNYVPGILWAKRSHGTLHVTVGYINHGPN